ncbi:hypothetical protein ACFX13_019091 [Malus domestica]
MWLVRRAEARALCNGISDCAQANWPALTGREKRVRRELLPRRLRSGVRGRDEIDGDDRNVDALAVEIRDLDKDDPDRHAISLLAGNLGIANGESEARVLGHLDLNPRRLELKELSVFFTNPITILKTQIPSNLNASFVTHDGLCATNNCLLPEIHNEIQGVGEGWVRDSSSRDDVELALANKYAIEVVLGVEPPKEVVANFDEEELAVGIPDSNGEVVEVGGDMEKKKDGEPLIFEVVGDAKLAVEVGEVAIGGAET